MWRRVLKVICGTGGALGAVSSSAAAYHTGDPGPWSLVQTAAGATYGFLGGAVTAPIFMVGGAVAGLFVFPVTSSLAFYCNDVKDAVVADARRQALLQIKMSDHPSSD